MRIRTLYPGGGTSFFQSPSIISIGNKQLKRCFYHLWVNIVPTVVFLIFSTLITMYISDQLYRAKLKASTLETTLAGHNTAGRK